MKTLWRRIQEDRLALGSLVFILGLFTAALFTPWIAPYSYESQDTARVLESPSIAHLMGTDSLGRDLFSRVLYGIRLSIVVGLFTSLAAVVIGGIYGGISGYRGGRIDAWLMRIVDVTYALPDILLVILITVAIGRGFWGIFLALTLVSWVTVARLIRGEVLRLREMSYVESARANGAGDGRILIRHILPNTLGPLIVTLTFRIPAAVLAESTLSFIGLGLAPPYSSLGVLANDGWGAIRFYPHLMVFPGIVLFLMILAFQFLGNGLQQAADPERGRG
ncbi:MAG: ABC transporter permease [Nitrospirae bacterium]|nr:ABC transporter permease [Nitrospirota bacterium]